MATEGSIGFIGSFLAFNCPQHHDGHERRDIDWLDQSTATSGPLPDFTIRFPELSHSPSLTAQPSQLSLGWCYFFRFRDSEAPVFFNSLRDAVPLNTNRKVGWRNGETGNSLASVASELCASRILTRQNSRPTQ